MASPPPARVWIHPRGSVSSAQRNIWSAKIPKVANVTLATSATDASITHVVWSAASASPDASIAWYQRFESGEIYAVTPAWMVNALQKKRRPSAAKDVECAWVAEETAAAAAPPAKRRRAEAAVLRLDIDVLARSRYPYVHGNSKITEVLRTLYKHRFALGGKDKSDRFGTTRGRGQRPDYINQFAISLAMSTAALHVLGQRTGGRIESEEALAECHPKIPYVGESMRKLVAEILRRGDGTCEELERHRDPRYDGFYLDSKGVPRVDEKGKALQWSHALYELQRVPGLGRATAMKCVDAGIRTIAALRAHAAVTPQVPRLFATTQQKLILNHIEEIIHSLTEADVEEMRCGIVAALQTLGAIGGGRGRPFLKLDPSRWDVVAVGGTRRRPPPSVGIRGPSHDADFLIMHPDLIPGEDDLADAHWFDSASGLGSDGSSACLAEVLNHLVRTLVERGSLITTEGSGGREAEGWLQTNLNVMRSVVRRSVNKTERGASNMDQMDRLFSYWRLPLAATGSAAHDALAAASFGGPRWDDEIRRAGERIVRVDLVVAPWCQRGFALMGWTGSTFYSRIMRRWLRSKEYQVAGEASGELKSVTWKGEVHTSRHGFCLTSHGLINVERAQTMVDGCACRADTDGLAFGLAKNGERRGGCTCPYWECMVAGDVNCAAPEERDVYAMLGLEYVDPWDRNCV